MGRKKVFDRKGQSSSEAHGSEKKSRKFAIEREREFFKDPETFKIHHPRLYRHFRALCYNPAALKCSEVYERLRNYPRNYVDVHVKVKDCGDYDKFNCIKNNYLFVEDYVGLWVESKMWRDTVFDLTRYIDDDQVAREVGLMVCRKEITTFKTRCSDKGDHPDDSVCPVCSPKHLIVLVRKQSDLTQSMFSDNIRIVYVEEETVMKKTK